MTAVELPDGVRLAFDDHGPVSAEHAWLPVVLVHGWLCDSGDWDQLLPWLTTRTRVVTVDVRGHGASSRTTAGLTPPQMADDVAAVLGSLGISRCLVFGHSAGAEVAVSLAVRRPELVAALVCVDPAYGAAEDDLPRLTQLIHDLGTPRGRLIASEYMARIDGPDTPPELARRHRERPLSAPPDVVEASFRGFTLGAAAFRVRPTTDEALARRRVPLFAVYRNAERAEVGRAFATQPDDVSWRTRAAGTGSTRSAPSASPPTSRPGWPGPASTRTPARARHWRGPHEDRRHRPCARR